MQVRPEELLDNILGRLNRKTIHELRQIGRVCGVFRPADGKKERIIDDLAKIARGELQPAPRTNRGAPPKSDEYDRQLVADFERCRACFIAAESGGDGAYTLTLSDAVEDVDGFGILYKSGKNYFLASSGGGFSREDVFVDESFVTRFNLKEGDKIVGAARKKEGKTAGLSAISSVNGGAPEECLKRPDFDKLPPEYASVKLNLSGMGAAGKLIDLCAPLALGQRGIIAGEKRTGATTLCLAIAREISEKYRDISLVLLLTGARPEEVSLFSEIGAQLFYTTFDKSDEEKTALSSLALEYAKRRTEAGNNTVLICDGLTRLNRAFVNLARVGGDSSTGAKKFMSCAKACGGCSLTVIATVLKGAGGADGDFYDEISEACNWQVSLSEELRLKRQFPAIDIVNSYSASAEKVNSEAEAAKLSSLLKADPAKAVELANIDGVYSDFLDKIK